MRIDIVVPTEGGNQEAVLTRWHKKVGDSLETGDALCEIESGKAALDVTAPCKGTLAEVFFSEGDSVSAGAAVAAVEMAGIPGLFPNKPATQPQVVPFNEVVLPKQVIVPVQNEIRVPATPKARRLAAQSNIELSKITRGNRPLFASDIISPLQSPARILRKISAHAARELAGKLDMPLEYIVLFSMIRAVQRERPQWETALMRLDGASVGFERLNHHPSLCQVAETAKRTFCDRAPSDAVFAYTGRDCLILPMNCSTFFAGEVDDGILEVSLCGSIERITGLMDELEFFLTKPLLTLAL